MTNKLKPIASTYIFRKYDKTLDLQKKMMRLALEGEEIQTSDIQRQLSDIERIYYYASKSHVMHDISARKVLPVYSQKDFVVPMTIPSFLFNKNGKVHVITNLSNHMTKNREGVYNIDTKMLFTLLQSGTVTARCYEKYPKLKMNSTIIKSGTTIYSKLFTKTLNKMFSLNTVPDKLEIAYFLSGLFFLVNVLGLDFESESTPRYALSACKNPNAVPIQITLSKFKAEDFADLDKFIQALGRNLPIFEKITTRSFLDNYIQMYTPNMMLSLEYLPIFFHNVFAVLVGAYINNQFAIEQTCGKDIDVLYKAFFSI